LAFLSTAALTADYSLTVAITGPTVIGFFPPYTQSELDHDDGSINDGMAQVKYALGALYMCLKDQRPQVRFEQTKSLTISDGARSRRIAIPNKPGKTVGIVLVRPGVKPMVVYALTGPSSLQSLALNAAADYFGSPACMPTP